MSHGGKNYLWRSPFKYEESCSFGKKLTLIIIGKSLSPSQTNVPFIATTVINTIPYSCHNNFPAHMMSTVVISNPYRYSFWISDWYLYARSIITRLKDWLTNDLSKLPTVAINTNDWHIENVKCLCKRLQKYPDYHVSLKSFFNLSTSEVPALLERYLVEECSVCRLFSTFLSCMAKRSVQSVCK